jgi:phage terminase small subunit
MPPTDFTKLSLRQRRYIEEVAKGKSRHQALIAAGYSPTNRPCRVENASIKAAFSRLMRQAVPAHKLAQVIAEGVEAIETKFFQEKGMVTDQRDVIAWSERREYARLAAEYGQYKEEEKQQTPALAVQIVVEHIGNKDPVSAETK